MEYRLVTGLPTIVPAQTLQCTGTVTPTWCTPAEVPDFRRALSLQPLQVQTAEVARNKKKAKKGELRKEAVVQQVRFNFVAILCEPRRNLVV